MPAKRTGGSRPQEMTSKEDLLSAVISAEIQRAEGADEDQLQKNRQDALSYYFNKPRGDEREGRSHVQSSDVADVVNAALANIVPMLTHDCLVEFEPNGKMDEASVAAENHLVDKLIMDDNNGFVEIQEGTKDALLLKNCCYRVYVEDAMESTELSVEGVPEDFRRALLGAGGEGEERFIDGDTITVQQERRRIRFASVPIERISYEANYAGEFQDIRFFAENLFYTKSELLAMGISRDLVDTVGSTYRRDTSTDRLRDVTYEEGWFAQTEDQDKVDCHEAYILIDLDGDGISERYRVLVADRDTVLDYEPVDHIPYAMGQPFINPHRVTGESLFDHMWSIQDIKTGLWRQWMDNATVNNHGRYVYNPSITEEKDVLTWRAGGGIRSQDPQGVVPLPINDVGPSISSAMAYADKVRTERGGAALDMQNGEAQLASNISATQAGIAQTNMEAITSMIARNLAESSLRQLYLLVHEYLRRYSLEPVMVNMAGTWQQVDPRSWPKRTRLTVHVGKSMSQRAKEQQAIQTTMQLQMALMQSGGAGLVADVSTMHKLGVQNLRLAGVENADSFWIDPQSPQARQAAQQQAAQQQAQAQAQQQMAAQQARIVELEKQLEHAKLSQADRHHDAEMQHKYYATDTEAAIAEAKIAGEGAIDLEKQRMSDDAKRRESLVSGATSNARNTGGA